MLSTFVTLYVGDSSSLDRHRLYPHVAHSLLHHRQHSNSSVHRLLWGQRRRIPRSTLRSRRGFLEGEVDPGEADSGLAMLRWRKGQGRQHRRQRRQCDPQDKGEKQHGVMYETAITFVAEAQFEAGSGKSSC